MSNLDWLMLGCVVAVMILLVLSWMLPEDKQ
jgi:hypothetical protein